MKIKGGYYIKARQIKFSDIAHAPPHVREMWDYLISEANHHGIKRDGKTLERGQLLTTYDEIREALHWMVGWRKMRYTKSQCETSMKFLRKPRRNGAMIATRKTTRGMVITILNYNFYQDPKNYESRTENHSENHNETCDAPQPSDTIDKNGKKEKKEKKEIRSPAVSKNGIPYEQIISYLNEKANTNYRHTAKATQQKIKARWNEGFQLDDFIKAIDSRVARWLADPEMEEYLRPDTIFNSSKFEGYVNAPILKPKDNLSEWEMK